MIALLALASAALAQYNGTAPIAAGNGTSNDTAPTPVNGTNATVTSVATVFTTYCPEPTTFAVGNTTYTVTEPTTLTITDCPYTPTPVAPAPVGNGTGGNGTGGNGTGPGPHAGGVPETNSGVTLGVAVAVVAGAVVCIL